MDKNMWLDIPMKITDITELNESFDACTLRVMYTGKNRNKTIINKEAVERAIPTLYNCPIVCNYNVETDTIGGHDVDIVSTDEGLKFVNLTDAIGVIPFGTEYYWEAVEEDSATREYLCVGGLLWKRTPAYSKIKKDGIEAESMEISIKEGKTNDGYFEIFDFSFTALCILGDGITPCFEGASIKMFSLEQCKRDFALLMEDLKKEYSKVIPASADDINTNSLKGGEGKVNLDELMAKYGLSAEDVNFEAADMTAEDLEAKLAEIANEKKFEADKDSEPEQKTNEAENAGSESEPENQQNYSLTAEQFKDELFGELSKETVYDECWECNMPRYWYVDYDADASEVYVRDRKDNKLYGLKYTITGDHVVIDFDSAKRKKVSFVDFEDGTEDGIFVAFSNVEDSIKGKIDEINNELVTLRKFKADEEAKQFAAAKDEVFGRFSDLAGNTMFEDLKNNSNDMTIDQIEDKCFAIRGRAMQVKFSANDESGIRMPVENHDEKPKDEPYGGVFYKYGIGR